MKHFISLVKTLLKTSVDFTFGIQKSRTKSKRWLSVIGIGLVYLYLGFIIYFMSYDLLQQFHAMNQAGLAVFLLFFVASAYVLLISITIVPSIFYFSKDVERLLVLPLKAWEIIGAKLLVTLFNLYITASFIFIPFMISYVIIIQPAWHFIPMFILASLVIPVIPLTIALVIMVVLFAFIPFFKNKEFFTYFSSILAFVAVFAFMNIGSSLTDGSNDISTILAILNRENGIVSLLRTFLPTLDMLSQAVAFNDVWQWLLAFIISFAAAAAVIFIIQKPYLQGVVGIGTQNAKKRTLTHRDLNKSNRSKHRVLAIMRYDWRNILRTPALMINYLLPLLIVPFIFIIPIFQNLGNDEVGMILSQAQQFLETIPAMDMMAYALIGGIIFNFLLSSFTTITSTSISREGLAMLRFRSMPIRLMDVIHAKIILGTLLTFVPVIIIGIILAILLKINGIVVLIFILAALLSGLTSNLMNSILDVWKPKLVWDNEQQAVKQNFLSVIPVFTSIALSILMIMLFLTLNTVHGYALLLAAVCIIISIGSYFLIDHLSKTALPQRIETLS